MNTFTLTAPIRFRVASSTVTFFTKDGEVLDNDVFKSKWANLDDGAKVTHVLSCDTPDLHLWKVEAGEVVFGMALRNDSNRKLVEAGVAANGTVASEPVPVPNGWDMVETSCPDLEPAANDDLAGLTKAQLRFKLSEAGVFAPARANHGQLIILAREAGLKA